VFALHEIIQIKVQKMDKAIFKKKLRTIVEDNTTLWGKVFDYSLQLLILVSLTAFAAETLPDNTPQMIQLLNHIEIFATVVFTLEYALRIYVAENVRKYIFSFYGIVDLLAILPFYLHSILDLRTVRVFRVFRVFRALKLVRYNKALKRFGLAAELMREELVLFLMVTGILIFIVSSGIYFFEHEAQPDAFSSIFHSLWWSVVTLTTVGYGDVYPITTGGRIFTFFVLIIGVGIVTIPAGIVASALQEAREIEEEDGSYKRKTELEKEIRKIKKR
jgi:voltage-gated potassium channel